MSEYYNSDTEPYCKTKYDDDYDEYNSDIEPYCKTKYDENDDITTETDSSSSSEYDDDGEKLYRNYEKEESAHCQQMFLIGLLCAYFTAIVTIPMYV
jgi:hypothetical protein